MTTTPRAAGVPTTYRGVTYRSRLEARWAAFGEAIGWRMEYEPPIDGAGYLPDFMLVGPDPVLVEVKPDWLLVDLMARRVKVEQGLAGRWAHDVLLVGGGPLLTGAHPWADPLGVLGEWTGEGWWWSVALWHRCRHPDCRGRLTFHHVERTYRSRICGHYDGAHYVGGLEDTDLRAIGRTWEETFAPTQWNAPRPLVSTGGTAPWQCGGCRQWSTSRRWPLPSGSDVCGGCYVRLMAEGKA